MGVLLPRIKIGTSYSHVLTRQDWQGIVQNLKYDRVVVLKVTNIGNSLCKKGTFSGVRELRFVR